MHDLWRAVDHEGEVLESFVSKGRDKTAALKFIESMIKRLGRPKAIATDALRSYGAALKALGAPSRQPRHLQAKSLGRLGRVARRHGLKAGRVWVFGTFAETG